MAEKIQAIVIKSSDKKEKDKNILLFSIEKGKFWVTLKGVKSSGAKMKLAQNPFCFGEFLIEETKAGKVVTGFDLIESFYEITQDADKYFEGIAVLEVLNSINENSQSELAKIFVLTLKTLKSICFSKTKLYYSLDKFLIEFLNSQGFLFDFNKCSCCKTTAFDKMYIDYSTGELVCTNCKNFNCEELSKTTFMALKILSNTKFEKLGTLTLSQGSELALLKILTKDFESRFEKQLKFMGILS